MNTARIATVAALAVALLVPVSAPAASAASPVSATGLTATAAMAPAGVVARVKSECKQVVSKKQAKKWKTLKPGTVSPKARWVNRALAVSSSKTYTPQTAKAVRAFERAVKLKANGTVSARDWCMLKALAKVKGPGQGGNGNGGNGNGGNGNGGGNSGAEDPFNTGIFQFTGWGDQSPQDTLNELEMSVTILSRYVENTTDESRLSVWHASGARVEEVFMRHAAPLLEEVRIARDELKAAMGTSSESAAWKKALPVWSKARLFRSAQFTSWAESWTQGDYGVLVRDRALTGGAASSAQTSLANFGATRDAYAARADADPELVAMTDSYLAWAEAHLPATVQDMEDLLVRWVEASVAGDQEWFAVLKDMRRLEDEVTGSEGLSNLAWVMYTRIWFITLSEGGDPRDDGLPIPGDGR